MTLTQILQKIRSAFYTKAETDTLLRGKSDTSHNHNSTYLGIKAKAESAKSADSVAWANVSGKPTKVSQFANDSGFVTSADFLPIGSYIQFAGSQAPEGFLVCNGGAISRTTYSKLFAVIGTTYGSGNGSTTFNLPDLTDRFLQGSTTSGTVKNAGLPNITGNNYALYYSGTGYDGASKANRATEAFYSTKDRTNIAAVPVQEGITGQCDVKFNASRSNSIYGNSSTVQPPALTCLICIKY